MARKLHAERPRRFTRLALSPAEPGNLSRSPTAITPEVVGLPRSWGHTQAALSRR
jgi:hypothetical protein